MTRKVAFCMVALLGVGTIPAEAGDPRCSAFDQSKLNAIVVDIIKQAPTPNSTGTFPSHSTCVEKLEGFVAEMIKGMADIVPGIEESTGVPSEGPEPYCVLEKTDMRYLGIFVAEGPDGPVPDSVYECVGSVGNWWH